MARKSKKADNDELTDAAMYHGLSVTPFLEAVNANLAGCVKFGRDDYNFMLCNAIYNLKLIMQSVEHPERLLRKVDPAKFARGDPDFIQALLKGVNVNAGDMPQFGPIERQPEPIEEEVKFPTMEEVLGVEKAVGGQKCRRCHGRNTTEREDQISCGDEGARVTYTCNDCKFRWIR